MSTKADLMADQLRRAGVADAFRQIHHFSDRDRFRTRPPSLDRFITYCEAKELQEENLQTIERGLHVARSLRSGATLERALADAWSALPVKKR